MKVLLAVDRSAPSRVAAKEVARRPWPPGSEVKVITVVEPQPRQFSGSDEFAADIHKSAVTAAQEGARALVEEAAATVRGGAGSSLSVTAQVLNGSPVALILEEAETWDADLIVVGSHDYRESVRTLLGSVSQAVAVKARCSVEIVRDKGRA